LEFSWVENSTSDRSGISRGLRIDLRTRASIPGLDAARFASLAADAKQNCPVSKALAGVGEITLDAALESG
jgi:osmotically inducible protein OsmC